MTIMFEQIRSQWPATARHALHAGGGVLALAAIPIVLAGCSKLLSVDLPGVVNAAELNNPQLATTLVLGAEADFDCALTNYAGATAALTDELIGATGWAAYTAWDTRKITPDNANLGTLDCTGFGFGVYTPIQTARYQAEHNAQIISGFKDADVPKKTDDLATLAAYEAYSYILLGEGFCAAAVDLGPEMTPAQLLQAAVDRFTTAIDLAQKASDSDILNLAYVGRARALLDLGQKTDAAADAALVPQGYVHYVTRSSVNQRRWNLIADVTHRQFFYSVSPTFRGLTFDGVPDPRVSVYDANRLGHDGITDVWLADKYSDISDPIVMASWEEAQLILAEARGGPDAVSAINALHAEVGLPDFQSSDAQEIQAQVIEERRRQFFLDGHRLGDMLRYNLPFPSGVNHKGQPYGDTTCLPLPLVEAQNNPSIGGS
jgi:starch-binding outer membrane protein, SusD/RagB family